MIKYAFIHYDLESTGRDPDGQESIIEVGATLLTVTEGENGLDFHVSHPRNILCRPTTKMMPDAQAVHRLEERYLVGATFLESWDQIGPRPIQGVPVPAVVAHNAEYERQHITDKMVFNRDWICSYRAARTIWPHAPSHKLGALFYWLINWDDPDEGPGTDTIAGVPINPKWASPFHRAGPDSYVNAFITAALLVEVQGDWKRLVRITAEPQVLTTIPFTKYRGQPFTSADNGLLNWFLNLQDGDRDVRHTAETILRDRGVLPPKPREIS